MVGWCSRATLNVTLQLTRLLERVLLPPGIGILLLVLTLWLLMRGEIAQKIGKFLLLITLLLIYFTTIPYTANRLIDSLEQTDTYPALTDDDIQKSKAQAIVILGYGRYSKAPEYGGQDTLSTGGLARVRYGAYLHKKTGLPILTSGGRIHAKQPSEAMIMKTVLESDFNTPVRWIEEESSNTWENARNSTLILKTHTINHIFMVTHSRDTKRALWSFKKTGTIQVTPSPTLFRTGDKTHNGKDLLDWIPNVYATKTIGLCLHEYLGQLWYWLQHDIL